MPSFPIIDTHLHVWDPAKLSYPWLAGNALLNKAYLPADYDRACFPFKVDKMVFIQAEAEFSQFREETAWVTALAASEPRIQGIVSWAPLEQGDACRKDLEQLAQNKLVKGEFEMAGRKVDLKNITCPVLNAFAEADHLVPPACSRKFTEMVGSKDTMTLAYPTGHIGMFTSHRSQTEYTPRMAAWLAERSGGTPASGEDKPRGKAKGK